MYNSESRKIHWETGEIEIDCRELSEERLIETMFESKLNDLRKLARKVGVSCKGRKLDIINRINDGLGSRNEKFNKVFQKFVGCSGGWLTVACPHGIIYAVKFLLRGESPRDYLDVLRSLKHKPNVFINDMAHIVAKHGNIHHGNFFKPHDGRVARPTPENIARGMVGLYLHVVPYKSLLLISPIFPKKTLTLLSIISRMILFIISLRSLRILLSQLFLVVILRRLLLIVISMIFLWIR